MRRGYFVLQLRILLLYSARQAIDFPLLSACRCDRGGQSLQQLSSLQIQFRELLPLLPLADSKHLLTHIDQRL